MQVKAIGQWSSDRYGNVQDGDILEIDDFMAEQFIARGYVTRYDTKVHPTFPKSAAENATSLPVDQPVQKEVKRKQSKAKAA
jgi:hypothetical protein